MTRIIKRTPTVFLYALGFISFAMVMLFLIGVSEIVISGALRVHEAIPRKADVRYYILRDYIKWAEPMPIRFQHSPFAITGIIFTNFGTKHAINVHVSIEELETEIKELVLTRENMAQYLIRTVDKNQEAFEVDACKGEKEISFKITEFHPKSYLTVFILTDKINIPIIARNRVFINGKKGKEIENIFEYTKKYKVSEIGTVIGSIVIIGLVIWLLWKKAEIDKAQISEQGKKLNLLPRPFLNIVRKIHVRNKEATSPEDTKQVK